MPLDGGVQYTFGTLEKKAERHLATRYGLSLVYWTFYYLEITNYERQERRYP